MVVPQDQADSDMRPEAAEMPHDTVTGRFRASGWSDRRFRLANIALRLEGCTTRGNIHALIDWGHPKDYMRMQWMMLQQGAPDDDVFATGKPHSMRDFIGWAAGDPAIGLVFEGDGSTKWHA